MSFGILSELAALLRADNPLQVIAGKSLAISQWMTSQSLVLLGKRDAYSDSSELPVFGASLNGLPSAASHAGQRWKFKYSIDASGLNCSHVDYTPQAGEMRGMTERVLDNIEWRAPVVRLSAPLARYTLAPDPRFVIARALTREGQIKAQVGVRDVVWPLQSTHDCSALFVFGYLLTRDPANPVQAIPADLVAAPDFMEQISGLGHAFAFVIAELVLCRPRVDFDPFGGSSAARCYPVGSVWVSETADIDWSIKLVRPTISTMASMSHAMDSMEPQGAIRCGLFADRNETLGMAGGLPLPVWSNLFSYYNTGNDQGVRNHRFAAVTTQGQRSFSQGPESIDTPIYRSTRTLMKVARQGAYDNVHLAPSMLHALSNGQPVRVFMAPVCQHDCFHMHWRWGLDFDAEPTRGWGPAGPNTIRGAVQVPLNQTVDIEVGNGPELSYLARADTQAGSNWAVFMHHGLAYVDTTSETGRNTAWAMLNALKAPRAGMATFHGSGSFARGVAGSARALIPDSRSENAQWAEAYYVMRHIFEGRERLNLSNTLLSQLELF